MSEKKSGIKKRLAWAAVGAGAALLLAPRTGKQTRELLARKTRALKKSTTEAYEEGKDTVARAAKSLNRDVKAVVKTRKRPTARNRSTRSSKA